MWQWNFCNMAQIAREYFLNSLKFSLFIQIAELCTEKSPRQLHWTYPSRYLYIWKQHVNAYISVGMLQGQKRIQTNKQSWWIKIVANIWMNRILQRLAGVRDIYFKFERNFWYIADLFNWNQIKILLPALSDFGWGKFGQQLEIGRYI